jgi:hypothetical protein
LLVNQGPALSIRAHGEDQRGARYDSTSRTAIIRVGSLTWTVQDLGGRRESHRW